LEYQPSQNELVGGLMSSLLLDLDSIFSVFQFKFTTHKENKVQACYRTPKDSSGMPTFIVTEEF